MSLEKIKCPKCRELMTRRTNVFHKSGKIFAYLCGNCGFRIDYNTDEELKNKIRYVEEQQGVSNG